MPKEITSKPKQTRKRIPRTCAQCRKRKQKCDSLKPCAVCRLRGEAELCDYEGAQPTRILDEDEDSGTPISTDELQLLRQKVEDMELAVNAIVSIQSNGSTNSNSNHIYNILSPFLSNPNLPDNANQHWNVDLEECNPALSLCDLMVNKSLTSNLGKDPLVVEKVRRQFLKSEESQPVTSAQCLATCNSSGLMTYFKKPMPMEHYDDLQSRLPTKVQAELMIKIYKTHFHWLHSCLDLLKLQADLINLYRHQSQQQQDQLYSIQAGLGIGQAPIDDECRRINLLKMGWLFAIARLAIWKLDFQDCLELELPFQDEDRIVKASDWFKMSLICLKCADYETYPHLESVNCLILLLEPVFFDQPHAEISSDLSLLFDLKTKLIYLGFDLSLNRDPYVKDDSTKPVRKALTKDVADLLQRRMTWWAILSIDGVYSDLMGRMSSILGLESVDVLVPALSDTVQADESHPGCEKGCLISTAACSIKPKIRISYLSHEITRLPSQRNPLPTLDEIKQAHEDLLSLESDLNQNYKLYPTINNSIDRSRLTNCSKAKRDSIYFYMRYHYLFVKLNRGLHFMNNEVKDDNESSSNNNRSSSSSATAEKRKRKAGSSNVLNHSTIDSNVNNSNSHGNSIKSNSSVLNSINPFHRSCVVDHALLLLDLRKLSDFSANYVYCNFMALEASFSLALDYLNDPRSERSNLIRKELEEFYQFIRATEVTILRRGCKILEFLIETINHQESMMIKNRASDNNQTDINTNNSLSSRNDQLYKNRFIDWFKASNYEILDLNGNVLIMADKVGSDSIGATDENFNSFGWPQGGFQQNSSQPLSFNNSTSTPTPKASEPLHQNLLANRSSDNLNKSLNDEKNSISIGSKDELNQYGSLKFFPGYDELIVPPGGTNNESSRTMPGIVGGSGGLNENCNLPNSSIEAQQNNFFENPNCSDFFGDGVTDNREGLMIHNQNQAYQQQQLQQQLDAQSYNKNNHYNEQFFNQTIIPQPPQTNHLHHHHQQQQQQLQQHHLQHQHPYHLTTPNHQPNIHLQQFHYNQQSQQQPHSSINDSNLNQLFQQ